MGKEPEDEGSEPGSEFAPGKPKRRAYRTRFTEVERGHCCAFRASAKGGPLTSDGLYKLVGAYGKKLGLKLAPHKLRHSAITIFLDNSDGNVLKAQGLSRHKDIHTLSKYDDNRKDRGGPASRLLEDLLDG